MCIIKKSGNAQPLKEIELMKYLECEAGKLRSIKYIVMRSLFPFRACVQTLVQYRRQLQHDTDIEPAWARNPNKARHSVLIEGG